MGISFYNVIQFILIGVSGGIMGGFFGVGAALIMVPLLVFWVLPSMQVSPDIIVHLAFGTSLAIVIPTSLSSSHQHSKSGNVDWRIVMYLVATGLLASYLGSMLATRLSGALLKGLFAILLIMVAVQMFVHKKAEGQDRPQPPGVLPSLVVGFLVGFFSGFFGVGGGIIAIPLMVRFLGISIHRSVGISISFVFFVSMVGTAGYIVHGWGKEGLPSYSLGYVHVWGWILAGIPSIFFAKWGAVLARKTKPLRLQQTFAVLVTVVDLRMFWDSFRHFLSW
ncbi:MAG: Sulfite exporter TauE/SafE [Syntrophorhabdus sp. PtaU1.Bin153]|nr:MAG: Sulfite exporter TauE/SafE [Syntrophorhabdus sp. PtaU1.Bin153]